MKVYKQCACLGNSKIDGDDEKRMFLCHLRPEQITHVEAGETMRCLACGTAWTREPTPKYQKAKA